MLLHHLAVRMTILFSTRLFKLFIVSPFSGILYQFFGKRVPFITLALIALLDGVLLFVVMRPNRLREAFDFSNNNSADKPKGTPIWRLLMDPYIAVCAGALAMVCTALGFRSTRSSVCFEG